MHRVLAILFLADDGRDATPWFVPLVLRVVEDHENLFDAIQGSSVLEGLLGMNCSDTETFTRLCHRVLSHSIRHTVESLDTLLRMFTRMECSTMIQAMIQETLIHNAEELSHELGCGQLCFNAAKLGPLVANGVRICVACMVHSETALEFPEARYILLALATIPAPHRESHVVAAVCSTISKYREPLSWVEVVDLIWALGVVVPENTDCLSTLLPKEFVIHNTDDIACIVWSMAKCKFYRPDAVASAVAVIKTRLSTIKSETLALFLWSLTNLGHKDEDFLIQAASYIPSMVTSEDRLVDMSSMMWSFAHFT